MKVWNSIVSLIIILNAGNAFSLETETAKGVIAIDWTHAETLLALGVTPIGVAQKKDYNTWVKEPSIPEKVKDIGLRTQPNLELISELKPRQIFISPMFSVLKTPLQRISPVTNIALYKKGNVNWQAMETMTRELALQVNASEKAESFIEQQRHYIVELKKQIPKNSPPVLMVQFMDANHLRVFGKNSLYETATHELGIENAWKKHTNQWGFSLITINDLVGIKARMIIIKPFPIGTERALDNNKIWQLINQASHYPTIKMPAVWSFGGLASTTRFAHLFVEAITSSQKNEK